MQFNIVLTADQIGYIGRCLGEKPYQEVVGIINAIQSQVDQQMAAQNSAAIAQDTQPKTKK
jgi:hypothetical protein